MEIHRQEGHHSPANLIVPVAVYYPTGNYMFKVNNRNVKCERYSKLTMKTPERCPIGVCEIEP